MDRGDAGFITFSLSFYFLDLFFVYLRLNLFCRMYPLSAKSYKIGRVIHFNPSIFYLTFEQVPSCFSIFIDKMEMIARHVDPFHIIWQRNPMMVPLR